MKRSWWWLALLPGLLGGCQTQPERPTAPESVGEVSPYRQAAIINTELGVAYMQRGANVFAIEKLQRALEQDPRLAMAHNAIAVLYERLGETGLAEEHFKLALKYEPGNSATRTNYGGLLCRQGRTDAALDQFERALADPLYERPELASVNAASCLREHGGDPDAVEAHLRNALRINPLLPKALIEMAELMAQRGDHLRTRAYVQRYHAVASPGQRSLRLGMAAELALGDRAAAQEYRQRLRQDFPSPENP